MHVLAASPLTHRHRPIHSSTAHHQSQRTTRGLCMPRPSTRASSPALSLGVLQASRALAPLKRAPQEGMKRTGASGVLYNLLYSSPSPWVTPQPSCLSTRTENCFYAPSKIKGAPSLRWWTTGSANLQAGKADQWNHSDWPPWCFKHQRHLNAFSSKPCPGVPHSSCDQWLQVCKLTHSSPQLLFFLSSFCHIK